MYFYYLDSLCVCIFLCYGVVNIISRLHITINVTVLHIHNKNVDFPQTHPQSSRLCNRPAGIAPGFEVSFRIGQTVHYHQHCYCDALGPKIAISRQLTI